MAGKSNKQVAEFFKEIFKDKKAKRGPASGGSAKIDSQTMVVALGVFVTDRSLASGTMAESYGFSTFDASDPGAGTAGLGGPLFDIDEALGAGSAETLFGSGTSSILTVLDILSRTDARSSGCVIFHANGNSTIDWWESVLRSLANDLFTAINESGDI